MRQPSSALRYLVILLALSFAAHAYADDRSEARTHYQAGVKYYSSGDYRGAIREFSAAQQLAPADLNNYNLALCYDKLGDAEPAVQYYRAFLDKQPNTDKRAEIEASINRLDAALRSASTKKADETRKAEDARRADEARQAEEARKAAEAAPPAGPPLGPSAGPPSGPAAGPPSAPAPISGPPPGPAIGPAPPPAAAAGPPAEERKHGPAIAGSIGTPGTGTAVPTGDSQLDRVNSINVDQVRDQRVGAAGSGIPDRPNGPAVASAGPNAAAPPAGAPMAAPTGASPNGFGTGTQPVPDEPKKETPVYKKWWFWAVVAVSGYVVYELATSSSTPSRQFGFDKPTTAQPSGLTLMRW